MTKQKITLLFHGGNFTLSRLGVLCGFEDEGKLEVVTARVVNKESNLNKGDSKFKFIEKFVRENELGIHTLHCRENFHDLAEIRTNYEIATMASLGFFLPSEQLGITSSETINLYPAEQPFYHIAELIKGAVVTNDNHNDKICEGEIGL